MGFVLGDLLSGGGPDYAKMAAQQEEQRQERILQGTKAINRQFAGFTPDFYKQRSQAYEDYALPQLSQQYRDVSGQIGFNLANRGLQRSTAARRQYSDLATSMATARQQIADTGIAQSEQLQKDVASSKAQQLSNLYASADPAGAAAGATAAAAGFSQPSTFAPLANMFANLLQQYQTSQLINAYRPLSYVAPPNTTEPSSLGPPTISY